MDKTPYKTNASCSLVMMKTIERVTLISTVQFDLALKTTI